MELRRFPLPYLHHSNPQAGYAIAQTAELLHADVKYFERQLLQQTLPSAPSFDHIKKLVNLITAPNRSQTVPFLVARSPTSKPTGSGLKTNNVS